jgi:hypothetical protein
MFRSSDDHHQGAFWSWLKSVVKIWVFMCGYAAAYVHSFCMLYCVERHVDMSTCLSTQYYSRTLLVLCHTLFIYFVCAVRTLLAVVNLSWLRQPDLGTVQAVRRTWHSDLPLAVKNLSVFKVIVCTPVWRWKDNVQFKRKTAPEHTTQMSDTTHW